MAAWPLAVLAIVAPQLLGGATPGTELAILSLTCAVCLWTVVDLRTKRRSLGVSPLAALGCFVAVGWTFLQIVPIPCRWADSAQPLRAHITSEMVAMGAIDAASCTLSWAPGSTRISLALATTLTALLLASVAMARAGYRDVLARSIALSSIVMALVSIAHAVLRLERVFGWYLPEQARPPVLLAPLLNSNHLAGHLALGFPLCLAYGLRAKRLDARIAWLGISFVVMTAGLLTLSRGGVVALGLGGGSYLLLHLLRGPAGDDEASRRLVMALASAVAVVALAALFTADLVAEELRRGDLTEKVTSMAEFVPLLARQPLVGVGRGALLDASIAVTTGEGRAHFAENLPLHWGIEWGVPAAVLIVALIITSFAALRPRRTTEWAVLCGLLALCAQNLVDFSLELAGISCVAAIAFGSLLSRESARVILPWMPHPQLRAACLASTAGAIAALMAAARPLTNESRLQLHSKLESSLDGDADVFRPLLARALTLYPMEPNFIMLGASRAVRTNSEYGPRWLNVAMEAAPTWAGPHLLAAYYLETHGHLVQAAMEIRFGIQQNLAQGWGSAHGFLKRHPIARYAREMLPDASAHRQWLAELMANALVQWGTHREGELFVAEVLPNFPASAPLNGLAVELALRMDDSQLALKRAKTMLEKCPDNPLGVAALIKVLVHANRASDALRAYDAASGQVQGAREVLMAAFAAASANRDLSRANILAEELFAAHGKDAESRAALHFHASVQFETAGDPGRALSHAQRSYELTSSADALERVHSLARRAGIMQVAVRAAVELCHLGRRREQYCQYLSSP